MYQHLAFIPGYPTMPDYSVTLRGYNIERLQMEADAILEQSENISSSERRLKLHAINEEIARKERALKHPKTNRWSDLASARTKERVQRVQMAGFQ